MDKIRINTLCGEIEGISGETCNEFRGIKYANAKRWEYPELVSKWDGVYDATEFGPCCCQMRAFDDDESTNPFYFKEFRLGLDFTYSEDCLFLNIWAPKDAKNCPVLVYVYGGSFTGGSADEGHIRGEAFAEKGIVYVAMNYRLGPYGFCSHPDVKDERGYVGNYGLYDQEAAIKWVKANIESFGGNPDDITIFGESAGAMSIDIQLSNPRLKGYYNKAIMMSGAAIQRALGRPLLPEKTIEFWNKVCANAKVGSMEELRSVDERTLFYAWLEAQKDYKLWILYTLPTCDGGIVTREQFNMKTIPDIPMIIGVTSNDMLAPVAIEMLARKYGKKTKKNIGRTWFYVFARDLPGDDIGAWHASDLIYAFKKLDFNWRPYEEIDYKIAEQINSALASFVKTGNPNCPEIPNWDPDYKAPLFFCENTEVRKWNTKEMLDNTIHHEGPI